MKKATLALALAGAMTVSAAAPAIAQGRWENQVTGSGVLRDTYQIDVSAREDGDVEEGMFQITYLDGSQAIHGDVNCYYENPETGAVAISGPIKVQEGGRFEDDDVYTVLIDADGEAARFYEYDPSRHGECGFVDVAGVELDSGEFDVR